jgi:hypothetical protein
MNNRKRTKGRKFTYVQVMKKTETKFGPVTVPDKGVKRKHEVKQDPNRPRRGEGLVYDRKTWKWIPNPRLK